MLEVVHTFGGPALGHDQRVRGERVVSERVIAVVVRVHQVQDGFLRDTAHRGLDLARHGAVDMRIDDEDPALAHDEAAIVDRWPRREERVYARVELLRLELDTGRVEGRCDEPGLAVADLRNEEYSEGHQKRHSRVSEHSYLLHMSAPLSV